MNQDIDKIVLLIKANGPTSEVAEKLKGFAQQVKQTLLQPSLALPNTHNRLCTFAEEHLSTIKRIMCALGEITNCLSTIPSLYTKSPAQLCLEEVVSIALSAVKTVHRILPVLTRFPPLALEGCLITAISKAAEIATDIPQLFIESCTLLEKTFEVDVEIPSKESPTIDKNRELAIKKAFFLFSDICIRAKQLKTDNTDENRKYISTLWSVFLKLPHTKWQMNSLSIQLYENGFPLSPEIIPLILKKKGVIQQKGIEIVETFKTKPTLKTALKIVLALEKEMKSITDREKIDAVRNTIRKSFYQIKCSNEQKIIYYALIACIELDYLSCYAETTPEVLSEKNYLYTVSEKTYQFIKPLTEKAQLSLELFEADHDLIMLIFQAVMKKLEYCKRFKQSGFVYKSLTLLYTSAILITAQGYVELQNKIQKTDNIKKRLEYPSSFSYCGNVLNGIETYVNMLVSHQHYSEAVLQYTKARSFVLALHRISPLLSHASSALLSLSTKCYVLSRCRIGEERINAAKYAVEWSREAEEMHRIEINYKQASDKKEKRASTSNSTGPSADIQIENREVTAQGNKAPSTPPKRNTTQTSELDNRKSSEENDSAEDERETIERNGFADFDKYFTKKLVNLTNLLQEKSKTTPSHSINSSDTNAQRKDESEEILSKIRKAESDNISLLRILAREEKEFKGENLREHFNFLIAALMEGCSSSYVLSLCEKGKVFSPLFELYEILIYIEEDDIDKANESLNSLETQLKERENPTTSELFYLGVIHLLRGEMILFRGSSISLQKEPRRGLFDSDGEIEIVCIKSKAKEVVASLDNDSPNKSKIDNVNLCSHSQDDQKQQKGEWSNYLNASFHFKAALRLFNEGVKSERPDFDMKIFKLLHDILHATGSPLLPNACQLHQSFCKTVINEWEKMCQSDVVSQEITKNERTPNDSTSTFCNVTMEERIKKREYKEFAFQALLQHITIDLCYVTTLDELKNIENYAKLNYRDIPQCLKIAFAVKEKKLARRECSTKNSLAAQCNSFGKDGNLTPTDIDGGLAFIELTCFAPLPTRSLSLTPIAALAASWGKQQGKRTSHTKRDIPTETKESDMKKVADTEAEKGKAGLFSRINRLCIIPGIAATWWSVMEIQLKECKGKAGYSDIAELIEPSLYTYYKGYYIARYYGLPKQAAAFASEAAEIELQRGRYGVAEQYYEIARSALEIVNRSSPLVAMRLGDIAKRRIQRRAAPAEDRYFAQAKQLYQEAMECEQQKEKLVERPQSEERGDVYKTPRRKRLSTTGDLTPRERRMVLAARASNQRSLLATTKEVIPDNMEVEVDGETSNEKEEQQKTYFGTETSVDCRDGKGQQHQENSDVPKREKEASYHAQLRNKLQAKRQLHDNHSSLYCRITRKLLWVMEREGKKEEAEIGLNEVLEDSSTSLITTIECYIALSRIRQDIAKAREAFSLARRLMPVPLVLRKAAKALLLSLVRQGNSTQESMEEMSYVCTIAAGSSLLRQLAALHENGESAGTNFFEKIDSFSDLREHFIEKLPDHLTVVVSYVLEDWDGEALGIIITRLAKGIPACSFFSPFYSGTVNTLEGMSSRFEGIMDMSYDSLTTGMNSRMAKWTEKRRELDSRLESFLGEFETEAFGAAACLLLPQHKFDEEDAQAIEDQALEAVKLTGLINEQRHCQGLLQIIIQFAIAQRSVEELLELLLKSFFFCNGDTVKAITASQTEQQKALIKQSYDELCRLIKAAMGISRKPTATTLVLDSKLQIIPIESIPTLRGKEVTRLPNFFFAFPKDFLLGKSETPLGREYFDVGSCYYMLDPNNNLKKTCQKLHDLFKQMEGWDGDIGYAPAQLELATKMSRKDIFMYCGHDAGQQFINSNTIKTFKDKSGQCKLPICTCLIGCSSVKHYLEGERDASSYSQSYMIRGSRCVVGNLWDVTDVDLDTITKSLVEQLKSEIVKDDASRNSLVACVNRAKEYCKYPFINGAAMVCYGVPIYPQSRPRDESTPTKISQPLSKELSGTIKKLQQSATYVTPCKISRTAKKLPFSRSDASIFSTPAVKGGLRTPQSVVTRKRLLDSHAQPDELHEEKKTPPEDNAQFATPATVLRPKKVRRIDEAAEQGKSFLAQLDEDDETDKQNEQKVPQTPVRPKRKLNPPTTTKKEQLKRL